MTVLKFLPILEPGISVIEVPTVVMPPPPSHPLPISPPSSRDSVRASVVYGVTSLVMVFASKLLASYRFDFPVVVLLVQMSVVMAVFEIARLRGRCKEAIWTIERGKAVLPLSIAFCFHGALSLSALAGSNIPICSAVKRCTPLVNLLIAIIYFRKPVTSVNRGVVVAVLLLTVGAVLASLDGLWLNVSKLRDGLLSVIAQAIYLSILEQLSRDFTLQELFYINAFNSIPILVIFDLFSGQIRNVFLYIYLLKSSSFYAVFAANILLGACLNAASFLCVQKTSALTLTVIGNTKAVAQTLLGLVVSVTYFGDITLTPMVVSGLLINLVGCLLYGYVKAKMMK